MRSLMGKLNKFALAPGSLSDISGDPNLAQASQEEKKPAPVKKAAPAPKKQGIAQKKAEKSEDSELAEEEAEINKAVAEELKKDDADAELVDLD